MTKKRCQWYQVCVMFAIMWLALGLFIWPLLPLAVISVMMMALPVGTSAEPVIGTKHDPEAWSRNR